LPRDLVGLVEAVRQAQNEVDAANAKYVYALALLSRAASGRTIEGGSAVDLCAHAVGLSRQTLQPYAIVALRWRPEELRNLLNLRTAQERPLSIAHLLVLARLPAADRETWLLRTVREGLDAHSLRALIARATANKLPPGPVDDALAFPAVPHESSSRMKVACTVARPPAFALRKIRRLA
jgi:hypothetical protein